MLPTATTDLFCLLSGRPANTAVNQAGSALRCFIASLKALISMHEPLVTQGIKVVVVSCLLQRERSCCRAVPGGEILYD